MTRINDYISSFRDYMGSFTADETTNDTTVINDLAIANAPEQPDISAQPVQPEIPALKLDDISCPITQQVFIEPVKTNCSHRIEKLAIQKLLRMDNRCPVCRTIVTSAEPDEELAGKIQNQFVKINGVINEENKKIFDEQKKDLAEEATYNDVRGASILPEVSPRRRSEMSTDELRDFLGTDALRDFMGNDFFGGNGVNRFGFPPAHRDHPPQPNPRTTLQLSREVERNIVNDNLVLAEQTAESISIWEDSFRNVSFENIANAYIAKADTNISNLQDATRIATTKFPTAGRRTGCLFKIASKYSQHKEFKNAFKTANKMNNIFFIPISYFLTSLMATLFGLAFVLKGLSWPVRALKDRFRA